VISADLIVKMLKKCIYSGVGKDKFVLTGFPDTNEQATEFEQSCAKLTAIIYASGQEPVVEIMNNSLEMFSIDALFQK
jgi:adenylate kinase family enzyme